MKMFRIRVNGNEYEVEVEEINKETGATPARTQQRLTRQSPENSPARLTAQAVQTAPAPPAQEGATTILAPMPGTIVDVQVAAGDKVAKGGTLMILEAMKMENEILAPHDCTVLQAHVVKGTSVNAGDLLIALT